VTSYRGFVVQNTTSRSLVLSTWTVCTRRNDTAYLAIYRRPTVPSTDLEMLACEGHAAAGYWADAGGYGAPASDNLRGSFYCPGLTKDNGGGVTLAACEKAAVVVEPFDDLTPPLWPRPADIRFAVDVP
jgi:hypothetical protein